MADTLIDRVAATRGDMGADRLARPAPGRGARPQLITFTDAPGVASPPHSAQRRDPGHSSRSQAKPEGTLGPAAEEGREQGRPLTDITASRHVSGWPEMAPEATSSEGGA